MRTGATRDTRTTRTQFLHSVVTGTSGLGLGSVALKSGCTSLAPPVSRTVDVVLADEDHQRTGEATVIELSDGQLLMVGTDFRSWLDDAPAVIRACRSRDGGKTWSQADILVANEGRKNVGSVSFQRISARHLLLFHQRQNSADDCRIYVGRSTDDGLTFSEPLFCAPGRGHRTLCNDCVIRFESGRLVPPFTVKDRKTNVRRALPAGSRPPRSVTMRAGSGRIRGISSRTYPLPGATAAAVSSARTSS